MKKLPARYLPVALPFVLSGIMSFLVTCVATLKGFGFVPGFVKLWMGAWAVSWPVAFPTALFALPIARRIVGLFVEPAFVEQAPRAGRDTASQADGQPAPQRPA